MSRATFAILSAENLLHNLSIIKQHAPTSKIIAMVKANAYGHGLRSTALKLEKYVHSFGVASIDEALALRKVNIKNPITLMEGIFEQSELLVAACEKFEIVFHHEMQIEWLKKALLHNTITAWIKIDTGMGRLGFLPDQAQAAYEILSHHPSINQPLGIMSHFACADEVNHALNEQQIKIFNTFIKDKSGPKSFCNSAAAFAFPEEHFDVIRPGIALYGISPFADKTARDLGLKPVMTLRTQLIALKYLKKGSSIGYGASYICPHDMLIGVIAMGYGDGYPRSARNGAPILVNGIRCEIVGRISMDMITINLSSYPDAQVGDTVILWGEDLPLEEVASYTNQSSYDMLTSIQSRVKFHWTLSQ